MIKNSECKEFLNILNKGPYDDKITRLNNFKPTPLQRTTSLKPIPPQRTTS